ncbi:rRNA maturation RNase YbeY [Pelagibacterium lentulum]|uniref:Endoribonuclease YbeY n=1 Tax=Pelagibacterium lentulum TaxID=2029865 RepID=A0A916R9C0_9HYPH|nr:rRNA maturation RNase YbeY [Pelagibacterium lentulum]GGA38169.1 endoribonuclease YbeY [Pelagibacterium lentulum]
MLAFDIDVTRQAGNWPQGLEPLVERAVLVALEMSGRDVAGPAEISIVLTDDQSQKELNRQWRGKDKPTNVLSFPQIEPDDAVMGLLGDIILAHETLVREAAALDKSFEAHFVHLLVHGMLHILGYDHQTGEQALVMETRETDIMIRLGYEDPYDGQDLDLDTIDPKTAQ